MAFRPLLRPRALAPVVAAATGAAMLFTPRVLSAEEPLSDDTLNRKPIYDDLTSIPSTAIPSTPTPSTPASPSPPARPTPTDRLAVQIGHVRLALYNQSVRAEDALNAALTKTLNLEHSFTSTVRSLAPPKESSERIFPGALYILVASMAGSILTRNRNILLRASVPLVIGLGAANAVLPVTSKNVGELVWTYEKRFPAVADTHLRVRERVGRFVETGIAHSKMGVGMLEDKVGGFREGAEEWVRKGR
ncbi:hypothetical protein P154DRAFT_464950, partial [Amniculicola lignicola CBS 123094]